MQYNYMKRRNIECVFICALSKTPVFRSFLFVSILLHSLQEII